AAESPLQVGAFTANPHTLIHGPQKGTPAGLKFWLVDKEYIYPLKLGLNTIGRAADNDVVLQDCFVSRRHCAVLVHTVDSCELHDTASKNGTYVNGHRIEGPTRLSSGDEIRMCERQLVFIAKPGGAPDPAVQSPTLAG